MRADLFLYTHGLAKSRTQAAALISTGVTVNGKRLTKPAEDIPDFISPDDIAILCVPKFVSRGGLKLDRALDAFGISVKWSHAVDIGASTGGFTDCLLQRGAERVYAVDVGHGQLDASLIADGRVVNMEGVNARTMTKELIGEQCPIAVSDISFISQKLIFDAVHDILTDGGIFVSLIKPQFEAGPEHVGKGGIVKDKKVHERVISSVFHEATAHSLEPTALIRSPIEGGDGNREYLAEFIKKDNAVCRIGADKIKECVYG